MIVFDRKFYTKLAMLRCISFTTNMDYCHGFFIKFPNSVVFVQISEWFKPQWQRQCTLRRFEIVFISPDCIYNLQFGLSKQCEIYHRNKWNIIESLYHIFFQKTCYHGNHITHLVAPPISKAIGLLKEQVGKIFSNSSITCYQEWSSKYVS